jgi:uncharacterized damage-inducible protein DinB
MNAIDVIRRMHEHRDWVNRKLLDAATDLSDEALRRSLPIGQGSVWKSLLHLHAAEYVWLQALLGHETALLPGDRADKLPGNQEGGGGISSLADLRERWVDLDAQWRTYLLTLNSDALEDIVFKVSSNGRRTGTRRRDLLLHVCTHAHYTAAQVVNMFRQLGVSNLPDPMLITLAREQPTGPAA